MTSSFSRNRDDLVAALENGEYQITFTKLDGVTKTIQATLIEEVLPEPAIQIHPEYVTLFSITDNDWRTVIPSRISEFSGPL